MITVKVVANYLESMNPPDLVRRFQAYERCWSKVKEMRAVRMKLFNLKKDLTLNGGDFLEQIEEEVASY